ncbi:peptidylprolyl isomerase [Neisseriaceae bacterium B1]
MMNKRTLAALIALNISFQAAAEIKPLNSIAIEANSSIITYGDIQRVVSELKSRPANKGIAEAQLVQAAKTTLLERALLADAARQMGLKVTDKQIDAELNRRAAAEKTSVNGLYKQAAAQGYSRQAYRVEAAKNILIERMFADLTDNIKISDAQINQAISQAQSSGQALPQGKPYTVYTIRRLLLNANSQANMPAVGERIQQIARAVQQGTPFETVASRYSQEPQAANGGIHDDITDGMLPAAAEELLHKMQAGQISTPVASGTTWQMLQLISSRTENNPEKMQREAVRRALLRAEQQKAQQQFIGQLQQSAVIREH